MLTFAIVDDDDYDRNHMHRLLTRIASEMGLKAEILLYNNGLDFLAAPCCDLVFMDIHMDPLDGLETARLLSIIYGSRRKRRRSAGSWKTRSGYKKSPSRFFRYRRPETSKSLMQTSAIFAQTGII